MGKRRSPGDASSQRHMTEQANQENDDEEAPRGLPAASTIQESIIQAQRHAPCRLAFPKGAANQNPTDVQTRVRVPSPPGAVSFPPPTSRLRTNLVAIPFLCSLHPLSTFPANLPKVGTYDFCSIPRTPIISPSKVVGPATKSRTDF